MIPLQQRQLLLLPKTVLLLNRAAITVYILDAVGRALCRLRKICLFATERAPNNSIVVAYPQVHHHHLAEISVSKHLVAVDSVGR